MPVNREDGRRGETSLKSPKIARMIFDRLYFQQELSKGDNVPNCLVKIPPKSAIFSMSYDRSLKYRVVYRRLINET